jgi:hypothetical protein
MDELTFLSTTAHLHVLNRVRLSSYTTRRVIIIVEREKEANRIITKLECPFHQ